MTNAGGRAAQGSQEYASYQQGPAYGTDPREARHSGEGSGAGAMAGSALAGVLMIIGGAIAFLNGLAMVIKGGFFVYSANYAYHWSTKGWGWTHLILGAIIFAAGFGVLLGLAWARAVGVVLVTLAAIASFLTIPFYPVWSIVMIAVDVFIIWALISRRRTA
jgi:hypothetical protein